jgi:chemotaxis signal transduction protein
VSVEERIRDLERQLLQLRRDVRRDAEPLPLRPFDVLELRVGAAWYAVPMSAVREVLQMLWCEPVAEAPPWVLGSFRYAGEVVPVVDLKQRLEGVRSECDPGMALVLVESPSLVGLGVDAVGELRRVEPAAVTPPREGIPQAPYLLGSLGDADRQLHLLSATRMTRELIHDAEVESSLVS